MDGEIGSKDEREIGSPHRRSHAIWAGTRSSHFFPLSCLSPSKQSSSNCRIWFWNLFHSELFLHVSHYDPQQSKNLWNRWRLTFHFCQLTQLEGSGHDNAGALLIPPLNIVWPPGFFFHRQSWIYISGVTLLFTGQTLDHILTQQFPLRPSCWPPASASCSTGCSTCPEPHIAQNPRYSGQVPTLQTPMAAHQLRCYELGFK